MRTNFFILTILLISAFSLCKAQNNTSPESEPISNWIIAAKDNDVELYKSIWTSDIFENYFKGEKFDWKGQLIRDQKMWRKLFKVKNLSRLNLENLNFVVDPYSELGNVKIIDVYYKERKVESYFVQLENNKWKLTRR